MNPEQTIKVQEMFDFCKQCFEDVKKFHIPITGHQKFIIWYISQGIENIEDNRDKMTFQENMDWLNNLLQVLFVYSSTTPNKLFSEIFKL